MKNAVKLMSWMITLASVFASAAEQPTVSTTGTNTVPVTQGHITDQPSSNADNTDINKRDKAGNTKTPEKQSNRTQDRRLLAAVRRAVVDEKSLSTTAHNAKILVQGGQVTLRGPVASEEEKAKVERLAQGVKGVTTVDNRLDIKTE
jgi:hyperosmotically inducible protein